MKHKHYDMIVAKAANMGLVVFSKLPSGEWVEIQCMPRWGDAEYFLCLPQHKGACLHWLDGGDTEELLHGHWCALEKDDHPEWHGDNDIFMNEHPSNKIRIKPRKEKRWIVINMKTNILFQKVFTSEREAIETICLDMDWQIKEIEVEV